MYNCPPIPCGPDGMPYGGGGGFMGPPPCPMNVMPMLPAYPQPRAPAPPPPPSCSSAEHNAKIIADVGAPFLEELAQLGECKKLTAEVNGKTYSLKLGCSKDKKRRRRSCSSSSSRGGSGSSSQGVTFKCCDCNVPVPPGVCQPDPDAERMALAREEKMHKCLSLCMQMMREMFRRKYEEQMAENEDAIQMVEIPVMVMPGGMGGMPGMDMMGMGMGGMPPFMGGPGAPCGPEKSGPCGTCSSKPEKPKVVCKTNRDQQCDESSLAPSKGDKKEKKGKGKGKGKGKKGKKK